MEQWPLDSVIILFFKDNFISVPIEPCESMEGWEDDDSGEYSSVDYIDNVEQSSVDCSMDVVNENDEDSSVDFIDNGEQSSVDCSMNDVSE